MGNLSKTTACFLSLVALGLAAPASSTTTVRDGKAANILVVHSYNPELTWTEHSKAGLDQGFQASRHAVTVYHEFLDSKRYPELGHSKVFLDYLQNKYQDTDLDVLMVADDPGLNLMLTVHDQYFPDLPVVFMGVNNVREDLFEISWLTGVFETRNVAETILAAQHQTQADHLIVLGDSTETGEAYLSSLFVAKEAAETVQGFPDIMVVKDVSPDTIVDTLGQYPSEWPVLLIGQLRVARGKGALLPLEQTADMLSLQIENPIYTESFMHLGHGTVGGQVLEGGYHVQQAVQQVEQILDGVPISQIEPIVKSKSQWIFDAKELKRANIDQKTLPPGSMLINLEPSFYEQHRRFVWTILFIVGLSALTILVLLDMIRRRKKSEQILELRVAERTDELSQTLQALKQTQMQLIQTEKLSSLGQLIGGMAHEFNNPLTFITGNIEILKDYSQGLLELVGLYQKQTLSVSSSQAVAYAQDIDLDYIHQDMPKVLKSMDCGAKRIESMVRSLQSFAHNDGQGVKPTDLNASLDNTLLILKSRLGNDIDIVKHYGELPLVPCDPGSINQVFMQVLLNAIDAVNSLGKNSFRKIVIHTAMLEDSWATITIQDSGPGVSPGIQDKIFDPFFTTKTVGEGTGLGLALSYQYVTQHGGLLTYEPSGDKGSNFIIQLPIDQTKGRQSD